MNYLVQHSDRGHHCRILFGFLFVMYIAVQLKPRKEGPLSNMKLPCFSPL